MFIGNCQNYYIKKIKKMSLAYDFYIVFSDGIMQEVLLYQNRFYAFINNIESMILKIYKKKIQDSNLLILVY